MIAQYLAEGPYRFSMAFGRGTIAEFYGATADHERIVGERKRWLKEDPHKYLGTLAEADELVRETVEIATEHVTLGEAPPGDLNASELAHFLGEQWEPDFLLLKRQPEAVRLVCGCVCFPSSWALEEKIGHPIEEIHGVVPSLNTSVGQQIQTFLERIKPGVSWTRSNWGLSRSPEWNQHPSRKTARLDSSVALDEVFFRVEEQSLVALPKSYGILFGIRLKVFPLAGYAGTEEGLRLVESLATMPEPIAQYKGLGSARARVIALLKG